MLIASTLPAAEESAFGGWHKRLIALCGEMTVEVPDVGFEPRIYARSVGGINMVRHVHTARRSERNESQLDRISDRHKYLVLMLQRAGRSQFRDWGEGAELGPGDLTLIDRRQPYTCHFRDQVDNVCVYMPLSAIMVRGNGRGFRGATLIPGKSGIGAVARSLMLSMYRESGALGGVSAQGAREALIDLCSALYSSDPSDPLTSAPTLRQRVLDFAEIHLADPDLGPSTIAAAHRVSVRHLHRIFSATEQSVSDFIRERRLERCRRDLLDPNCRALSVSQIAYRWGFNDSAHFSRIFKAAYEVSPRDLRKCAGEGGAAWSNGPAEGAGRPAGANGAVAPDLAARAEVV
jgi:AraC-like DNA-binding protein